MALHFGDGIAAVDRVALHDGEFLFRQPPRLEQDGVRDADLADVVQGRGLEQQGDVGVAQFAPIVRQRLQLARQRGHVMLHPADVVDRLAVARLGQCGQGPDHRLHHLALFGRALLHQVFDQAGLVAQQFARATQLDVGGHPRQQRLGQQRAHDDVGRPALPGALLGLRLAAVEQHEHRDGGRVGTGAQLFQHAVAVDGGQGRVQQHQVRARQLARAGQRGRAIARFAQRVLVV